MSDRLGPAVGHGNTIEQQPGGGDEVILRTGAGDVGDGGLDRGDLSENDGSVYPKEVLMGQASPSVPPGTVTARPPLPPFTRETAIQKVRMAEDAWNTCDPERVSLAYTSDSRWRNRSEFINGRGEIVAFLKRKWSRELDYRLIKELWAFEGNRIAVRFAYESHDDSGNWYRSYGNENWEFDDNGLMRIRHASINDRLIAETERKYHWPLGRRPDEHPGLSELGF
jgi:nuclear transport factor 2 (NTF2) superfamily protein